MSGPKIFLIAVWLFSAGCFVVGTDSTLAWWGRLTFYLMVAAHLGEFLVFRSVFEKAGGSMGSHAWQTLAFGFLHIQDVKKAADETAS